MRYLQLLEQFESGGISVQEAEALITAMAEELAEIAQALDEIRETITNAEEEKALDTLIDVSQLLSNLEAECIFL